MSLLDSQEVIEQNTESAFPITEEWLLRRIQPEKNGYENWLRYSIKCRKEFIDIISNCKEI